MTPTDEKSMAVVTLLLEARGTIEPAVAEFLEASERLEAWLAAGLATDAPTVRTVGPHVYDALLALEVGAKSAVDSRELD